MIRTRLIPVALVGALVFAGGAYAQQNTWKRIYVGKSAFSLSLPNELKSQGVTEVEDKEDWVVSTDEYEYQGEDFILLVSVFNGKAGTKADERHLAQVAKDLVTGLGSDGESVKETGRKTGKVDERPTILQAHILGTGEDASLFKSFLLGDGSKVYAVMAIGYPNDPKSVAAIDKVFASIRFKTGLKD